MLLLSCILILAQQGRILLQCRKHRFHPRVGKIPWRRKWQPTPVFLPEKSHGQGSTQLSKWIIWHILQNFILFVHVSISYFSYLNFKIPFCISCFCVKWFSFFLNNSIRNFLGEGLLVISSLKCCLFGNIFNLPLFS